MTDEEKIAELEDEMENLQYKKTYHQNLADDLKEEIYAIKSRIALIKRK